MLDRTLVNILCKQDACFFELLAFQKSFPQALLRILSIQCLKNLFFALLLIQKWKNIINHIVNDMYGSAVDVHNDVIAVVLVLMDHIKSPFYAKIRLWQFFCIFSQCYAN